MRDDEVDYRGKFWIGQRVQVFPERIRVQEGFARILGRGDTNAVGSIFRISVRFLKTPDLRVHVYCIWMDKPMTNTGSHYYHSYGDDIEPIEQEEEA